MVVKEPFTLTCERMEGSEPRVTTRVRTIRGTETKRTRRRSRGVPSLLENGRQRDQGDAIIGDKATVGGE